MITFSSDWLKTIGASESVQILKEFALPFAEKGGEQGIRIASYIAGDDFLALCNFDLDYCYPGASIWELQNCRQALGFFQKLEFIELPGVDKEAVAFKTFVDAERSCAETNDFFRRYEEGLISIDSRVSAVFHSAQRKIARVLGDVPSFSALRYRHGPGSTTLTKKSEASIVEKLQAGLTCSEELYPYIHRILEEMPHLVDLHTVEIVDGGRFVDITVENDKLDFAPKNAKTHRGITQGTSLNLMVQLALGDHIADCLGAFGIDLKDQSINQEWAALGSVDGSIATVDSTSASDLIATSLVSHLFPIEWFIALGACRSRKVDYKGQTIEQEKFAGMGNGYTFALESLIFWALASSCTSDGYASVYGDDVIIETQAMGLLEEVFRVCGFQLNKKKSYSTGPFRESCGADYHTGVNIRPYYQKKLINGEELFKIHNFMWRNGYRDECLLVKAYIHPELVTYGPDGYGDGHLLADDWSRIVHSKHNSHGYGGVLFTSFKHAGRYDKRALRRGDGILPLYTVYRRPSGDAMYGGADRDSKGFIAFLGHDRFHRRKNLGAHSVWGFSPEPIPERVSQVDQSVIKTPAYPGSDGYRRTRIYTFDAAC